MKQFSIPIYLWLIVALVGLLNYIPIFYYPNFLNDFYFEYKIPIIGVCFLLLVIFLFFGTRRKIGTIVIVAYLFVLTFSKQIRKLDNQLIIEFNKNKELSDFKSPILGYKLEISNSENTNDVMFDALFIFNHVFGIYDALVFKKAHGLTMSSFEGDYSLYKIYNQDWWWYKKMD